MADIELVIKIPDKIYETIKSDKYGVHQGRIYDIIRNGKVIPKEHGRLGDLDELERDMVNGIRSGNYEEGYEKYAHINSMDDCVDAVKYADTIIEADKVERSDKE